MCRSPCILPSPLCSIFKCISICSNCFVTHSLTQSVIQSFGHHQPSKRSLAYFYLTKDLCHYFVTIFGPINICTLLSSCNPLQKCLTTNYLANRKWGRICHKSINAIIQETLSHLKDEICSSVWSTKTFLYDIREPKYKQIKMGNPI